MRKSRQMRALEARVGQPIDQAIVQALNTHETLEAAAASLGVNMKTMYSWMLRLGIRTRKVAFVA